MRSPILFLLLACGGQDEPAPASDGTAYACEADLTVTGFALNDHIGFALGSLGPGGTADWNGDGVNDLLMGSYQKLDVPTPNDNAVGSATLVQSPWSWSEPRLKLKNQVQLRIEGESGDRFGRSVAWLGDLDGDGRDDFAVGDIRGPRVDGRWTQRGRVYVFLSADRDTELVDAERPHKASAARASLVIEGEADGQRLGHGLAGVGDLDGDGRPEVLLGAPGSLALVDFAGRAYLLSGGKLAQAAPLLGGMARSVADPKAPTLWRGEGGAPLDGFGFACAAVGADAFAVGAAQMTLDASIGLAPEKSLEFHGPGYVRVVAGEELDERRFEGSAEGELFGFSLGAADLDGDGVRELLVGSPGFSREGAPRTGRALAFDLTSEGRLPIAEVRGEGPIEMCGWTVVGYGQIDGEGGDEWAVGSFGYTLVPGEAPAAPCPEVDGSRRVPQAGRVRLLRSDGAALGQVLGERNADSAGAVAAYLGDLDGSGGTELVFAAFRWDEPAPRTDAGKVCLFRDFATPR
ncbi:MAG: integrin alpha [Planctomycetota bacterium]